MSTSKAYKVMSNNFLFNKTQDKMLQTCGIQDWILIVQFVPHCTANVPYRVMLLGSYSSSTRTTLLCDGGVTTGMSQMKRT
jgi:hypothetical protein